MNHHDRTPPVHQPTQPAHRHGASAVLIPVTLLVVGAAVATAVAVGRGQGEGTAQARAAGMATAASLAGVPSAPPSPLKVDHLRHDFGNVPIDGGVVKTTFTLTNETSAPVTLVAAYTSCMCTTATLRFADGSQEGPFGMPGHDLPVTLSHDVAPGASVTLLASFDPGAHGPDAVGPVERMIALHTADGARATVTFTANVVKR